MNTDDLIRSLASNAAPVRRLAHPMMRAGIWLMISAGYVAAVVLAYRLLGNSVVWLSGEQYIIEQLATVTTAFTAAIAAFCCIVPGRDRLIGLLPLVPLAIWLATMGEACLRTFHLLTTGAIAEGAWECLPPSVLIGLGPAIVMWVMLKRGAPLYPRSTVALGALAAAALGNLGLRLFHEGDVTLLMLTWHLGALMAIAGLGSLFAPRMLAWPESPLKALPPA